MKAVVLATILLLATQAADAALHCVSTTAQLTNALNAAATNAQNDTIRITSGTFNAPQGGWFYVPPVADQAMNLTISGGWDAGCGSQLIDSSLTKLSGHDATRILSITRGQANVGELRISGLSFVHAFSSTQDYQYNQGLALSVFGHVHKGPMYIEHVVVNDNSTFYGVDVMHIEHDGTLYFRNNLVVNNQSGSGTFGVVLRSYGDAYISHNTIANNTVVNTQGVILGLDLNDGDGARYVVNNIIWGNALGNFNVDFAASADTLLVSNSIGAISGVPAVGSNDNFNVNPQFVSGSDFRLKSTSPLHDIGSNTPFGGIIGYDLKGMTRILDGVTDLGAYETQASNLFKNSFE